MKRALFLLFILISVSLSAQMISVSELGRYTDGREDALEIVAYDQTTSSLFITNAATDSIDIIDVSTTAAPIRIAGIDITPYGGGVNSVAVVGTHIAAAIEADNKQENGVIVFFTLAGQFETQVTVGALPDMLTATPDGTKVLVANEGEPDDDYLVDPAGSVSIIDITGGISNLTQADVTTLTFDNAPANIPGSLRKPGTPYSIDLEPEYITVNSSSTLAAVSCQESNVLLIIDLSDNSITYKGLGFKDHSLAGNGFDPSNEDGGINILTWNVKGVYQPDAIASYEANGNTYFLTANEGDGRDYDGYSSETRIKDLTLDPTAFPNAANLQQDEVLGRLKTFTIDVIGDTDTDGDIDELYSYGARSFSIWDDAGNLVWDSGDDFEQYIAANHPDFFNCNDGLASESDNRSDDKGPEPEAVTVGVIGGTTYAFVALERQGGVMVYDISDPLAPVFETYINSIQGDAYIDIAPEGLVFVPESESHTGTNLLIVSHEVSGTATIYEITDLTINTSDITALDNGYLAYPNPVNDYLKIASQSNSTETVQATLFNTLGHQVSSSYIDVNDQSIDMTTLNSGIYMLTLRDENGALLSSKKVVKL